MDGMYLLDLSLGSIPFKMVPLIPVLLPLLECVLEALSSKPTKNILQFPLDLLHSVKATTLIAAASSSGRGRSRKGSNLVSKADAEV
jgi:hypothetical protein